MYIHLGSVRTHYGNNVGNFHIREYRHLLWHYVQVVSCNHAQAEHMLCRTGIVSGPEAARITVLAVQGDAQHLTFQRLLKGFSFIRSPNA